MPFSVKSERADELLRDLRALTGEGITEAVTRALDERLARTRAPRGPSASDMMWHLDEFRRKYPEFATSTFAAEDLYDEDGLPR